VVCVARVQDGSSLEDKVLNISWLRSLETCKPPQARRLCHHGQKYRAIATPVSAVIPLLGLLAYNFE